MQILYRLIFVSLLLSLAASPSLATTFQVGPARTYTNLQSVVDLLNPGDVVEVDGDVSYPGDVVFTRPGDPLDKITIRGMRVNNNRPVISGGTNTVTFQTPHPYSGDGADHYVFEGFVITGGTSRGVYHQADDLTLRDVRVYDCPAHGILGADQGSGSLTMEFVEVYGCGDGTYHHQIYMATDEVNSPGSIFRMQHCYVHDGNGGNNVKSRAERNEIYYNWIEGAYYHELELIGPDGGDNGLVREDSDVVGNVLRKTRAGFVARVGGDGTGETNGRYRFVNNTIISHSSSVFRLFDGIESIEMHNNVMMSAIGGAVDVIRTVDADWATGVEIIAGSYNWVPTGTSDVPLQWTSTRMGATPGFTDISGPDFSPAAGSDLIDHGTAAPASPPGYNFPAPLLLPLMHPPRHAVEDAGTAQTRPSDGQPDIGAYEADGSPPAPEIALFGNGQPIADGDTACDLNNLTDFGSVAAASDSRHIFTIQNVGGLPLSLTGMPGVEISGMHANDFSVSATPATSIPAAGQTTFEITFAPQADGLRTAVISIANNDTDENPYDFSIQGTGGVSMTPDGTGNGSGGSGGGCFVSILVAP